MTRSYYLLCDGGSRGNPGPSASGWIIVDARHFDLKTGNTSEIIASGSRYLGITTNNQAEYDALIQGLIAIKEFPHPFHLIVFMDSQLAIHQLKGNYKVKNQGLRPLHTQVLHLLLEIAKNGSKYELRHVKREINHLADGQVNKCLDEQTRSK